MSLCSHGHSKLQRFIALVAPEDKTNEINTIFQMGKSTCKIFKWGFILIKLMVNVNKETTQPS